MEIPGPEALSAAHERIAPFVHRTRVVTNRALNDRLDADVFLKCEQEQRAGSFKIRGATNHVAQLTDQQREVGIVTHSSGNHAQAVACAGGRFGVPVTVVMPENANPIKRAATEEYGATVVPCADSVAARHETTERFIRETGAHMVHPYDDPKTVAGAATATMELLDEVADLDLVLTPVGGGGLSAGAALACAHFGDGVRFVGTEPAGADDAARGLGAGARVTEQEPHTIADGLRTTLGELNFRILSDHGVPMHTVSEAAIVDAMRFVWERAKLLIEPSSAVPVAALLGGDIDVAGKRIGVVLTGGNVDARAYFDSLV